MEIMGKTMGKIMEKSCEYVGKHPNMWDFGKVGMGQNPGTVP